MRILWQYPEGPNPVVDEFKELNDYCYPDLHNINLENVKEGKSDHSTFTWTDNKGVIFYGFCYRNIFRGTARRFDVSRRPRLCLCIISRYPYYHFFKNLLMDIYSFGLLESYLRQSKAFADHMFNFMLSNFEQQFTVYNVHQATHLPKHLVSGLKPTPEFSWILPCRYPGKSFIRDISISPLLQALGVEKFFKLISALLTERSIVIMADLNQSVSDTVLAAASLLHPFRWKHDMISMLPKKQLSRLGSNRPYLVGLQRVPSHELRRFAGGSNGNGGIVLIDLDAGDIITTGSEVRDLVGDAGTALKQATESLDRVRAGVASVFLGKNNDNNDLAGNRDLMAMLVQDLKSTLASKPGTASIQSVASGLIRGLPGTGKTTNEAKIQWNFECEKAMRDSLTCFYAFLFADIEDYILSPQQQQGASIRSTSAFGGNGRARINFNAFMDRKRSSGASPLILDFLQDFVNTAMFAAFLDEKITAAASGSGGVARERDGSRLNRSSSTSSVTSESTYATSSTGSFHEVDELFEVICGDLRCRAQQQYNANVVKQLISSRSALGINENSSAFQGNGSNAKVPSTNFHLHVLQFTSASGGGNSGDDSDVLVGQNLTAEFAEDFGLLCLQVNPTRRSLLWSSSSMAVTTLERIIGDCYNHENIRKVFITIAFRLEACKASNCRGQAGLSGVKALQLLQILLIQGPMQTIAFALDLIPLIRNLLRVNVRSSNSPSLSGSGTAGAIGGGVAAGLKGVALPSAALDLITAGPEYDPKPLALATLSLLVDHRKLITQRTMITIAQHSGQHPCLKRISYAQPTKDNLQNATFTRVIGQKTDIFASNSRGGFPQFAKIHNHFNELKLKSAAPGSVRLTVPEKMSAEREDDDDNTSSIAASSRRTTRSESASAMPGTKNIDLLSLSEENSRFRLLNQDTGDVFDIREVEKNYEQFIPSPTVARAPAKLAPPPLAASNSRRPNASSANARPMTQTAQQAAVPTSSSIGKGFANDSFVADPWGNADPFATPITQAIPSKSSAGPTNNSSSAYLAEFSSMSAAGPPPSGGRSYSPIPVNNGLSGGRSVSPVPSIPNPYGAPNNNNGWSYGGGQALPSNMQMPVQGSTGQSMQFQFQPKPHPTNPFRPGSQQPTSSDPFADLVKLK